MSDRLLFLNQSDVARFLPMDECIEAMADAFRGLAEGEALLPLRQITELPDDLGLVLTMPSYLGTIGAAGVKVLTVYPRNEGTPIDAHQGLVVLFEAERGRPVAVADASEVTAIRTAAVSGLATRLLAREDARELAIVGSGKQARTHLEAIRSVRPIERVRVWSRTAERARSFAAHATQRFGLPVEAAGSAEEAVRGADIICTVTSSSDPVVRGAWVEDGTHLNAVGYAGPKGRELDADAVARSRLIVDRRAAALAESGDVLLAIADGAIDEGHIAAELADVVAGRVAGRISPQEITLFESLGLAIEDLAAAHHVYRRAVERGGGTAVTLREGGDP